MAVFVLLVFVGALATSGCTPPNDNRATTKEPSGSANQSLKSSPAAKTDASHAAQEHVLELMKARRHASAAQQLQAASADAPGDATLHYLHGLNLLALGRCDEAANALERGLRLARTDAGIAEAWIRTRSSCAPGRRDETLALAAELFTAVPDASQAEAYAMALAADAQFGRALQLQRRASAHLESPYSDELMRRYEANQPAVKPWADDASVFTEPLQ